MRKALIIIIVLSVVSPCFGRQAQDSTLVREDADKVELEAGFWDDLLAFQPKGLNLRPGDLQRVDRNLYVMQGGWYEDRAVQNTAFFRREHRSWMPVCSSEAPTESVITLLTGYAGQKDYTVHLLQHRYNFVTVETEMPLSHLLEYCISNGYTPYVGIESKEDDTIKATLFMVNPEAGFCHTFHFSILKSLLDEDTGVFNAEAYTYTPINNLKQ